MIPIAHESRATPCQGLRTTALGEVAASLLKAYLFFRHNTYDAGEGCFVPSNVTFDAKEVTRDVRILRTENRCFIPDWTRQGLCREHSH